MKKKLKLRLWVKLTLCITAIILLLMLDSKVVEDGIKQCVNGGHNEEYCERELSK